MEALKIANWEEAWWITGVVILLVVSVVGATIMHRRNSARGTPSGAYQILRFLLVPVVALHLLLLKVFHLPAESLVLKITETVASIVFLALILRLVNHLFLSENNVISKRVVLPKLGRDLVFLVLVVLGASMVLSHAWGIHLGHLLTALGVGSLVIGLALQEPLGNLFNGLAILMANPFQEGDWLSVDGEVGKVVDIHWRSVKIHTMFNEEIVLPNNLLGKEKIKNLSRPNRIHAMMIEVGFSYDDPPEKVKRVLEDMVAAEPRVLDQPAPRAMTLEYGDFYIGYGLKVFYDDFEGQPALKDELMTQLYAAAETHGLTMPFPRQDVRVLEQ